MSIGILWQLRLITGKTPIEAYVRAWMNGVRAGKRNSEAQS